MFIEAIKISFLITNSYSLKDKRKVIKGIVDRVKKRYNVSISEIEDNDIHNKGVIGIAIVGNKGSVLKNIMNKIVEDILSNFEIEILEIEEQ